MIHFFKRVFKLFLHFFVRVYIIIPHFSYRVFVLFSKRGRICDLKKHYFSLSKMLLLTYPATIKSILLLTPFPFTKSFLRRHSTLVISWHLSTLSKHTSLAHTTHHCIRYLCHFIAVYNHFSTI